MTTEQSFTNGKEKLWTGRWLADGKPECVEVPIAARINGGRGLAHYLAKGLKPLETIPAHPDKAAARPSTQNSPSRKGERQK